MLCYRPIQESYVDLVGVDCYDLVRSEPELSWEERKTAQNRRLHAEHPEWLWVLEREETVFGFVTFWLPPERHYGHIDNNGVHPHEAGRGWATFMYSEVLRHFRRQGLRFAHVDTGLDDAHLPARRAYEAVGFGRRVPTVAYSQRLADVDRGAQ
ncbi:hypothetical protein BH18CHL2_BH18CHL2_02910 [soil metagenome]